MGLGNNRDYKTTERRVRKVLAEHADIMARLIAEGKSREDASAEALAIIQAKRKAARKFPA